MRYWLMKTEPEEYSIDDLERDGSEHWDGIRSYQARNLMRDQMSVGDRVLFYHSNAKPPGVVGLAEVVRDAYPDHTQFDPNNPHYDPKSDPESPTWLMVDVGFVEKFGRKVGLDELRTHEALAGMPLLNKSRLSVQPVSEESFRYIVELARRREPVQS